MACAEVRSLFRSPESLQRLDVYRGEFSVKREEVRLLLGQAIAAQVEDTKQGVQLLQQASSMIAGVRSAFLRIDAYCRDVQRLIADVSPILRVNLVRKNVDATMRLLDKFRSLPEQCDALLDDMYEHDRHIKAVYKALRRLTLLRATAFDPAISAGFSADFTLELTETFQHLSDAADEVELRIWENIAEAFFLAKDDSTVLVRTLEVIEMEDRARTKVFSAAPQPAAGKAGKAKAADGAAADGSAAPVAGGRMKERALLTLEKSIADSFADLHKDEAQAKKEKRAKQKAKKKADDERKRSQDGGGVPSTADAADANADADAEAEEADAAAEQVSDYVIDVLEQMQGLVEELDEVTSRARPVLPSVVRHHRLLRAEVPPLDQGHHQLPHQRREQAEQARAAQVRVLDDRLHGPPALRLSC